MSADPASDFQFDAPVQVLHEIAIVNVEGGIKMKASDKVPFERQVAALHANREHLAVAALKSLSIPQLKWGDAVSSRGLIIMF